MSLKYIIITDIEKFLAWKDTSTKTSFLVSGNSLFKNHGQNGMHLIKISLTEFRTINY